MAKSSKAKKKSAKSAKKTYKKAKKKTTRKTRLATDPCEGEEQGLFQAQLRLDEILAKLDNPDLSPEERKKLEGERRKAQSDVNIAVQVLGRCRRQHPGGGDPH